MEGTKTNTMKTDLKINDKTCQHFIDSVDKRSGTIHTSNCERKAVAKVNYKSPTDGKYLCEFVFLMPGQR